MQWILGLGLAVLLFVILKHWGALAPAKKKAATWKLVLAVAGVLLLFMVLTGRVHILTAGVAALIPLLRKLPALMRYLPMLSGMFGQARTGNAGAGPDGERQQAATTGMTREQACEILGVEPGCSREDIIAAHRRLMQKIHPDRGGNDYLAAQVNTAKVVLLGRRDGSG